MAARVRPLPQLSRRVTASLLLVAAGCRGEAGEGSGEAQPTPAVPTRVAAPAPVPTDADAAVEAILDRCHGGRRGGFGDALIEVGPGPHPDKVLLSAPAAIRVSRTAGAIEVFDGRRGFAFGAGIDTRPLTDEEVATLIRLRDALTLVVLHPLERRSAARRLGPDRIAVDAPGGEAVLTHDGDAPRRLARGDLAVDFVDFHVTPTTRVPTRIAIDGLGSLDVRFVTTGVDLPADAFQPPAARATEPIDVSGAPGSQPPRVAREAAVQWLLLPDRDDWEDRIDALIAAARRLQAAGYTGVSDPVLTRIDDTDWFALPFVAGRDDADPVPVDTGQRVVDRPRARLATLELPQGPFAERVARGRDALQAWCAEQGHRLAGPLEVAVNVGDPSREVAPERMLVTLRYRIADADDR